MHSEKMRVKAYHSGCPKPNELSFNSVGELHKYLKNLENMDTEDNLVSQVDFLLPFSRIQVKNQSNFIFIDIRKTNKISFCGLFSTEILSINKRIHDCWEQNGKVTIVDTPGISDSIEYRTMLDEYIPKAVAFIIVIDVSRTGGLHGNMVWKTLAYT